MRNKTGMIPVWRKALRAFLIAVLVFVLAFAALIGYLTVTEYFPAAGERETLTLRRENDGVLPDSGKIRVLSWNIGYGALGAGADFFMDGGKSVNTADKALVLENVSAIAQEIARLEPDIVFLQETDLNSMRSHHVDELGMIEEQLPDTESAFAYNFKVPFIPYPVPPIGTVNSGIATLSSFHQTEVFREALPCPFSWPLRVANLKRCLLVSRIPAEGGKELMALLKEDG